MSDRPLFVGIGNAFRRDDGLGPWVAEALAARGLNAVPHAGDGAGLLDHFAASPSVVLIDATRSGAAAGTLRRLDARAEAIPAEFFHYSTHRFGLAEAVETARALGLLPARLIIYGIEGSDFGAGLGLSAPVPAAATALITALIGAGETPRGSVAQNL